MSSQKLDVFQLVSHVKFACSTLNTVQLIQLDGVRVMASF